MAALGRLGKRPPFFREFRPANAMARRGYRVEFIDIEDVHLTRILGEAELERLKARKTRGQESDDLILDRNPDLLINGRIWEVKALVDSWTPASGRHGFNPNSMWDNIERSVRRGQARRFIIDTESIAESPEEIIRPFYSHGPSL